MRKFDINKCIGNQIVTRNGKKVAQIEVFNRVESDPKIAVQLETGETYFVHMDGRVYTTLGDTSSDLFISDLQYGVRYREGDKNYMASQLFNFQGDARAYIRTNLSGFHNPEVVIVRGED